MLQLSSERLSAAYQTALIALLAERNADGYWTGELSTSALSTATAVSALALVQRHTATDQHSTLIASGLDWLAVHQNADGGWGDTIKSVTNISTTMLCFAAFHIAGAAPQHGACLRRTEVYLQERHGKTPEQLAEAVRARYGKDRTFSVPILMTCALAGLVKWQEVPPLPFELACFPQSWFRFLRLPVVSYALPALIAIGQAVYHHRPPNPITRLIRWLSRKRSLRVLETIQPSSGGFLEATPLTSFVTMGLASIGQAEHPVARRAVEFLVKSVRPDGSWPIDTNLATWVTTLSVNALATAGELQKLDRLPELRDWLLKQQYRERHPYTGADPGGWAWTDLPGGVPDADDTPGAILALARLFNRESDDSWPITNGIDWLLALQNRDGGWPTFCRGWGTLPFDRSGPDLTAHVLRALAAWRREWLSGRELQEIFELYPIHSLEATIRRISNRFDRSVAQGFSYLIRQQRPDGSWLPLWFGNQYTPNDENPTYGTTRVLAAYRDLDRMNTDPARRGVAWLLAAQNADGGWGGAVGVASSIEETALAVEVLLDAPGVDLPDTPVHAAVNKGLAWLVEQVETGGLNNPTPIGFYFAKLWYFEKLYPVIFTVAALGRALRKMSGRRETPHPQPLSPKGRGEWM